MGRLIRRHGGHPVHVLLGVCDALGLAVGDEGQRPPLALAERHHDAAAAGLVLPEAAVHAVLLSVRRTDRPAEVGAVDLDVAGEDFARLDLAPHGFAQLVGQHEGRLIPRSL